MPVLTLDRRTISGFVQYAGERPEPPFYLRLVDGDYAHPLGAAVRFVVNVISHVDGKIC